MQTSSHPLMIASLIIAMMLALTACGADKSSPEQAVRATLAAIEKAAEDRSLSQLMEYISDDYQDHQGQDKKSVARLAQLQFIRNQQINIFTRIQSLEVVDGLATVELSAAMAAREVDLSLESNRLKADTHRFSIVLEQEGDQWLVQSVSWQRGW